MGGRALPDSSGYQDRVASVSPEVRNWLTRWKLKPGHPRVELAQLAKVPEEALEHVPRRLLVVHRRGKYLGAVAWSRDRIPPFRVIPPLGSSVACMDVGTWAEACEKVRAFLT